MTDKYYKGEGFPDLNVPNAEKKSLDYGLKVGRAIQDEWFIRKGGNSRYYSGIDAMRMLRLYARGEQPTGKYKKLLSYDGDLSYLNLDFSIVPIIPKFVDIVANGMIERGYNIKVEAIDKLSTERKSDFRKSLERDMNNKDFLYKIKEKLGVNVFRNEPHQVPDTPDELELYMQLEFKQAVEIGHELLIENILEQQNYDEVLARVIYDLVVLGKGVYKHEFIEGQGINVDYVDPERFVHSYTEDTHGDDAYYGGEVKRVAISELAKNYQLDKKQIEEIKQKAADWRAYHGVKTNGSSDMPNHVCEVLFFSYKTNIETRVFKKRRNKDGDQYYEKPLDWNPPQESLRGSERVAHTEEVWFQGAMVLGTDIILDWRMEDFSIQPKSGLNKPMGKYVMAMPRNYNGRVESLVSRMQPFGDDVQLIHLKLQQVASKVIPDGIFIDADGLMEIDLGNGRAYNPDEALKLFFQTGSVIGRSRTFMGQTNPSNIPIKEITHSSAHHKIDALIRQYEFALKRLRDVTGINELSDGSTPNPKTLVGVQENAILNSNRAVAHLLRGTVGMVKRLSEGISARVVQVLDDPQAKKQLINQIGKNNVKILESLDDMKLHDFGMYVELLPDHVDQQKLERDIGLALDAGQITPEDAVAVRDVKNYKLATRLLGVKIKKREETAHQRDLEKIERQNQGQMQLKQMEQQLIQLKEQARAMAESQIKSAEGEEDRKTLSHEASLKRDLMMLEAEIQQKMAQIQGQVKEQQEKYKEDRKDLRQAKQNTANSRITDQRSRNATPINFESEEDSLDGFPLDGFEPR